MALKAKVETLIQIESFKNIDISKKGIYYFKLRLFHKDKGYRYYAYPMSVKSIAKDIKGRSKSICKT